MSFETVFGEWLTDSLAQPVPPTVKAFSFNLFELTESPDARFGIELVGMASFSDSDPDWACDEAWEPTTRNIVIPTSFSGSSWEECLTRVRVVIVSCLGSGPVAERLKSGLGVGFGFIDGDLEVLWQR